MKFSYFSFKLEQVVDGKFDGTRFEKACSPTNSYLSDDSIPPEQEQSKLDSEIESDGNPNPPSESTPKLAVDLEMEQGRS